MTTGMAQRNREVGRAIRGEALFSGSAAESRFPGASRCVPVAYRVQQLLVGVCEFGIPGSFLR